MGVKCRACGEPADYAAVKWYGDDESPTVVICCIHCAVDAAKVEGCSITLLDGKEVNINLCYINWVMHCNMVREWQGLNV